MEKFEYHNEEPGVEGLLATHYDVSTGQMMTRGVGFYSVRQTTAYFEEWRRAVERIHAGGHYVTGLVDLSEGAVQKAEVGSIIGHATAGIYTDGDAIAMLMPSSLAKMQMRRILDPHFHDFFISRNAAETWLEGRSLVAMSQRALHRRSPYFGLERASHF